MTTHNIAVYGLVGAISYGLPKALTYLCTRPDATLPQSRLDLLRGEMASLQERINNLVGDKVWFIATDVLADNACLASLIILCISKKHPLASFDNAITTLSAFLSFSTALCAIRFYSVKAFPPLAPYVVTRSYSMN